MKKRDEINIKNPLNLGLFLGKLEEKMNNWDTHFTNHLSKHKWDRLLQGIYWLSLVMMFCWLRWGTH